MEEQLISFETAKLAKEKGFNIYYEIGYSKDVKVTSISFRDYYAPTQSLLQKWIREVHDIHIMINFKPNIKKWDLFPYNLLWDGKEFVKKYRDYYNIHKTVRFNSYEEALEEGLLQGLKLIKNE